MLASGPHRSPATIAPRTLSQGSTDSTPADRESTIRTVARGLSSRRDRSKPPIHLLWRRHFVLELFAHECRCSRSDSDNEPKYRVILERALVLLTDTVVRRDEEGRAIPVNVVTLAVLDVDVPKLEAARKQGRLSLMMPRFNDKRPELIAPPVPTETTPPPPPPLIINGAPPALPQNRVD